MGTPEGKVCLVHNVPSAPNTQYGSINTCRKEERKEGEGREIQPSLHLVRAAGAQNLVPGLDPLPSLAVLGACRSVREQARTPGSRLASAACWLCGQGQLYPGPEPHLPMSSGTNAKDSKDCHRPQVGSV